MAKTTITETDLTASNLNALGTANSVIFIPIVKTVITTPAHSKVLCKNVEELETVVPLNNTTGYYMAKHLLSLGMNVLVGVFEQNEGANLGGIPAELEDLKQRNLYNIRFVVAGDLPNTYIVDLVEVADDRGDCVALIDHSQVPAGVGTTYVEKVVAELGTNNSPKVAHFTPWCQFQIKGVEETKILPGSLAYLAAHTKASKTNPIYFASAGATRGIIPGLVAPVYEYGESEATSLQEGNAVAVNPIMKINPYGYVVWGNRTSVPEGVTLKASNFLNISLLVTEIVKHLVITYNTYAFEQNTDILWINFKSQIKPTLDRMKSGLGILDYDLLRSKKAVKGKLKAIIKVIPVEAVEDFDIIIALADNLEITITE